MRKITLVALVAGLFLVLAALPASAGPGQGGENGRPHPQVQVFVTSQGLYYESIVVTDLPQHGPFQQLHMTSSGLQTEFGPGAPGYLGGRWWVDANGDGEQNEGDAFFLCPLLGPGSPTP